MWILPYCEIDEAPRRVVIAEFFEISPDAYFLTSKHESFVTSRAFIT